MKKSYIERAELGGRTSLAQFGWQQMQKIALRTELLDEQGQWSTTAIPKPQGRRLVFESSQKREKALDVYKAWERLTQEQVNDPVFPEVIFRRLALASSSKVPVTLFIPWGVRPEGRIGAELAAIDRIQEITAILQTKGVPSRVLLMPADIYATDVNGINKEKTDAYFREIGEEAKRRGFEITPWSTIRTANRNRYDELASSLTEQKLEEIMKKDGTMERIFKAARRRSETGDPRRAAYDYLRERICEAIIVEEIYQPIKLSLAPKNKDNNVDSNLPRLYLIPSNLQLPWLK